jgi:hypothetical protein
MTLYFYAIEALALLTTADASVGWKALRWRPGTLLTVATVAFGLAVNGGLRGLFLKPINVRGIPPWRLRRLFPVPHGFLARTLGAGRGGWGCWLFAEGTLTAIIIAALGNTVASAPLFLVLLAALALSTGRPEGAR